ncbi:MAG: 7-carboxy-7-deazaguanine synthase QueE, partial [Candidatus Thorarchaeota archaeon]
MKLSEVYTSVQGEGPRVGVPTTFVRFGGCNLRCPGWGSGSLPDGTSVRGCDTIFAVYPEYRSQWESVSVRQLLERIPPEITNVCITGGEPLIQPTKDLNEF